MSLSARRKQKATSAATKNTTKKNKKNKKNRVSGPMRSIAIGRAYREHEPVFDDDGKPKYRHYFDPQGTASCAIDKRDEEVSKDRVVNSSIFFDHINETVFKQIFGVPFRRKVARMVIEGISDQCLVLTEQGWRVKLPNLVTMGRVERAARKARNPKTNTPVDVPARSALAAKATRSARAYMQQSG